MKQISRWAAAHVWPARILLVSSQLLMSVLALAAGFLLQRLGVAFSGGLFWLAAGAAVLAALFYPQKGSARYKLQYARRKICDLTLVLCTLVMIVGWAGEAPLPQTASTAQAATTAADNAYTAPAGSGVHRQTRVGRLVQSLGAGAKRLFHRFDEEFGGLGIGWQIALIALLVAGGIGAGILVVGLACSLACNGLVVLSWIVLLLGWGGIVVGEIFGIRSIIRKGKHYRGRFRRD